MIFLPELRRAIDLESAVSWVERASDAARAVALVMMIIAEFG
jgi:hypothetical protein